MPLAARHLGHGSQSYQGSDLLVQQGSKFLRLVTKRIAVVFAYPLYTAQEIDGGAYRFAIVTNDLC